MTRQVLAVVGLVLAPSLLLTYPSVYPTGTTIFHPDKTWSGYTVLDTPGEGGTVLIDMNGNLVRRFRAYRVPYDWVPQLERPIETAVIPPPIEEFRVPPN